MYVSRPHNSLEKTQNCSSHFSQLQCFSVLFFSSECGFLLLPPLTLGGILKKNFIYIYRHTHIYCQWFFFLCNLKLTQSTVAPDPSLLCSCVRVHTNMPWLGRALSDRACLIKKCPKAPKKSPPEAFTSFYVSDFLLGHSTLTSTTGLPALVAGYLPGAVSSSSFASCLTVVDITDRPCRKPCGGRVACPHLGWESLTMSPSVPVSEVRAVISSLNS